MTKMLGVLSAVLLFSSADAAGPSNAPSQQGFGLGVILGEPTGISGKLWVGDIHAVDAGVAWSFSSNGYFHLHADYLWHNPLVLENSVHVAWYLGVGGRIGFSDDDVFGIRFVGGFTWWPRDVPLDVFLEVAPIMDLVPATKLKFNGGIGARFYFN